MPTTEHPNVLPLEGEIDLHVSPRIAASLNAMMKDKPKLIVVDLAQVSYIDSSGLAALIATHNLDLAARMDRRVTIQDGLVVQLA